ncbi:hypothetical protein K440DRAFT_324536 [Wilcoxina mikolae CBS 423.85]|nr:hypothetical protein K440DRAFT_324536 [Wilcoxina mikolae CBS 423.85]
MYIRRRYALCDRLWDIKSIPSSSLPPLLCCCSCSELSQYRILRSFLVFFLYVAAKAVVGDWFLAVRFTLVFSFGGTGCWIGLVFFSLQSHCLCFLFFVVSKVRQLIVRFSENFSFELSLVSRITIMRAPCVCDTHD